VQRRQVEVGIGVMWVKLDGSANFDRRLISLVDLKPILRALEVLLCPQVRVSSTSAENQHAGSDRDNKLLQVRGHYLQWVTPSYHAGQEF
jgi:hypothetical protein